MGHHPLMADDRTATAHCHCPLEPRARGRSSPATLERLLRGEHAARLFVSVAVLLLRFLLALFCHRHRRVVRCALCVFCGESRNRGTLSLER
jgi:hypothetical protein